MRNTRNIGRFGVRDWLVQRVTAVILALYLVVLVLLMASHCPLDFQTWQAIFEPLWFKVFSLLFLLSMLMHAWVGMWTVLTDYVKPWQLRLLLMLVFILMLTGCFFWGLQIFWGV